MPIHDWSRLSAGAFHGFHVRWIAMLTDVMNTGLLPPGYFADCEQVASRRERRDNADILTLRERPTLFDPTLSEAGGISTDASSFAETRVHLAEALPRPRRLVVRESQNFEVVALLEIVSAANRDRRRSVRRYVDKIHEAVQSGVHAVSLDLLPSGRHDAGGMHAAILSRIAPHESYAFPGGTARTVASYASDPPEIRILVAHPRIGDPLPDTPLFLMPDLSVNVPLEQTYLQAYRGTPLPYRERLEAA